MFFPIFLFNRIIFSVNAYAELQEKISSESENAAHVPLCETIEKNIIKIETRLKEGSFSKNSQTSAELDVTDVQLQERT